MLMKINKAIKSFYFINFVIYEICLNDNVSFNKNCVINF